LVQSMNKWVNGTALPYAFLAPSAARGGAPDEAPLREQVRKAFDRWASIGIGVRFEEVSEPSRATIRIGFVAGDGHWSYLGRDALLQGVGDRTMNLDPRDALASGEHGVDVACHEIGHALGFPH